MVTKVVCTIIILFSGGRRDVVDMRGIVVRENNSNLLVDFTEEFNARKIDTRLQPSVQLINGNSCQYEEN